MQYLLGIGMPGLPEMLIIMVVILVLFGGKQIPSLMRNLGKGATEFKRGLNEPDRPVEPEPEAEESATEPEAGGGDDEKSK